MLNGFVHEIFVRLPDYYTVLSFPDSIRLSFYIQYTLFSH